MGQLTDHQIEVLGQADNLIHTTDKLRIKESRWWWCEYDGTQMVTFVLMRLGEWPWVSTEGADWYLRQGINVERHVRIPPQPAVPIWPEPEPMPELNPKSDIEITTRVEGFPDAEFIARINLLL